MRLLDLANEALREMYLQRAKQQNWTRWENAGPEQVAHIQLGDKEVIAALVAIERFLNARNAKV